MEEYTKDLDKRLTKLEEWRLVVDVQRNVDAVDRQYLKEKFDSLEKNLNEFKERINTQSNRVLWAIATPVITAVVVFALSGKFS